MIKYYFNLNNECVGLQKEGDVGTVTSEYTVIGEAIQSSFSISDRMRVTANNRQLDISFIECADGNIQINQSKLDELLANEYKTLRKAAYIELNQDELRYEDTVNGTNTWGEAIEAIKAKYPKSEER